MLPGVDKLIAKISINKVAGFEKAPGIPDKPGMPVVSLATGHDILGDLGVWDQA